jgi:hypothetical protein
MPTSEEREEQIRREIRAAAGRGTLAASTEANPSSPADPPSHSTVAGRRIMSPVTLGTGMALVVVLVAVAAYMLGRSSSSPPAASSQAGAAAGSAPSARAPVKPAEDPAAKEALSALKALASVTSVGVTYQEYMRRLGDAKIKIDEVSEQIRDPETRTAVATAMSFYEGTGNVWNAKIQKYDLRKMLEPFAASCQLIVDLFNRPTPGADKYLSPEQIKYIQLEVEGVPTMMGCASQKVAELTRVIERKATPQPGQTT